MKKFLLGTVGLVALGMVSPASAADLAARPYTKAPPPMMVAMYDWSGFYIGLNGGGGWSHKCWDNTVFLGIVHPAVAEGCHDATGGTVGGQIGYRWQASSWVFGVEAQGNWADFTGSNQSLQLLGVTSNRSTIDGLGLFTGQVGYAWNSALLYVKGGAAVTHDKYQGFVTGGTNFVLDNASETRWGGVIGAGLEFGFAPNWSVGVEYDHLFMGTRDVGFTTVILPFADRTDRIHQDVDMVTVRLNYKFGMGKGPVGKGPVTASY
jgi:outer membrane immunogenic protein